MHRNAGARRKSRAAKLRVGVPEGDAAPAAPGAKK